MKTLVFLADGTRNDPKDRTNVFVTYQHLLDGEGQKPKYDEGVGTTPGNLLRGAMFGRGLSINVIDGFTFLSQHYDPGDRIYLFGFSRGAYTVRSLASWISLCGLAPRGASRRQIRPFWQAYKRNRDEDAFPGLVERLHGEHGGREAEVEAVCVWDTVGAIGRQTRTRDIRKKLRHKFHRMSVYPRTKRV